MNVSFKFSVGESVVIIATGVTGKVLGNHINSAEQQYTLVQYADTSKTVHQDWFAEADLAAAAGSTVVHPTAPVHPAGAATVAPVHPVGRPVHPVAAAAGAKPVVK
jgi:hypothetical protein